MQMTLGQGLIRFSPSRARVNEPGLSVGDASSDRTIEKPPVGPKQRGDCLFLAANPLTVVVGHTASVKKPTVIVLVSAVLVTAAGALFWPRIAEWARNRQAQSALLEQPVYRVLREHEPEVFKRVADKYVEFRRGAETEAGFINFANGALSEVSTRRLAHASDAAVLALMSNMVANARSLQGQPGDACFRFLFPHVAGPPDVARHIDAKAQAHTLDVMAEVIRSSAESPQPLPDASTVQDSLSQVANATFDQYGVDAQMIANAEDPRVDRAKVCTMTLSLYDRILARPPADASALIRVVTARFE